MAEAESEDTRALEVVSQTQSLRGPGSEELEEPEGPGLRYPPPPPSSRPWFDPPGRSCAPGRRGPPTPGPAWFPRVVVFYFQPN